MSDEKREYNLTRDATIQRQNASLRTGLNSKIISKLSNCHNCFFRVYCQVYAKSTDEDKDKGCKDMRNVWLANMKLFTQPENMILKTLADTQTMIDYRQLMDGKMDEMSREWMFLIKMKKDFLKLLLDYQDTRAKYSIGTKKEVTIHHIRDDEDWSDVTEVNKPNMPIAPNPDKSGENN